MLINFFLTLRKYKVPVTLRELMDLLAALKVLIVYANIDDFYLLSRTCLVKDERNYDKFDRAFSAYFKGLEDLHGMLESLIPDEWLRREFEKTLTAEELEKIARRAREADRSVPEGARRGRKTPGRRSQEGKRRPGRRRRKSAGP